MAKYGYILLILLGGWHQIDPVIKWSEIIHLKYSDFAGKRTPDPNATHDTLAVVVCYIKYDFNEQGILFQMDQRTVGRYQKKAIDHSQTFRWY